MIIIKKGTLSITLFIFVILLTFNVSAGIYFSQLQPIYNLGDTIDLNIDVSPESEAPLKITLFCDGNSTDVYRGIPINNTRIPLTNLWVNGMTGECYFSGEYNKEIKESVKFKISKKLDVLLSTNSLFAKPGESITISGTAKRLNGIGIDGDIEINIPLLASISNNTEVLREKLYEKVVGGEFSMNLTLNKDTPSGDYRIDVLAYEETREERTSEGIATANLNVFQVLTDIDLALDVQNIDPGKNISFKPILLDQAEHPMKGDVSIIINGANSGRIFEQLIQSEETIEYRIPTNLSAGYYEVEAFGDGLTRIKKFYVNEKALVLFEIRNGTLAVTNIGNIPYNKSIQIEINGKSFVKKLNNLEIGKTKEFKLTGIGGEYDIKISDGETELSQGKVSLPTGAVIGVSDFKKGSSIIANTPIILIFIIILLGAVILFLFRDVLKKKSFAYPADEKTKYPAYEKTRLDINAGSSAKIPRIIKLDKSGREIKDNSAVRVEPLRHLQKPMVIEKKKFNQTTKPVVKTLSTFDGKKSEMKPFRAPIKPIQEIMRKEEYVKSPFEPVMVLKGQRKENIPNQAEQVLVTDGQKNRAAVIVLKIKNQISKFSKENLERAIEHVYDKKGAVHENGNYIFVVFSPLITKSSKNEIEAIKAAEKIAEGLTEHNRRFSEKIEFGIAVNAGDIINKIENKKLKFTSLGSLTNAVKKLADFSKGEILLTKNAYERAMAEVKAEKREINGIEAYEVKKVADYEKNKKFIQEFLKRDNLANSRHSNGSYRSIGSPVKNNSNFQNNKNNPDFNLR